MKTILKKYIVKITTFLLLSILAFSFLYPLIFMFINSFKTKSEYRKNAFALPAQWNLDNYYSMISQFGILQTFANTFFIAAISISVMMILAVFASYAFAKLRFRGKGIIYVLVIATMFIPPQVTMIPMYYLFSKFHLVNTYTGVILSYIAGGMPGAILLLTANFRGIPGELLEAARMDGAGYFKLIRHVIFPMGKAVIAINVILTFVTQSNDLFTPMILLNSLSKRTMIVALSSIMTKTSGDSAFQLTGMLLAIIPPLCIYLGMQKYFVKGITAGAIK